MVPKVHDLEFYDRVILACRLMEGRRSAHCLALDEYDDEIRLQVHVTPLCIFRLLRAVAPQRYSK